MKVRTFAVLFLVGLLTVTSAMYSVNASATSYFDDGFETGNFANWDGYRTSRGETLSVSSYRSYFGSYSAVASSNGRGSAEYSYCYKRISDDHYTKSVRTAFYVARSGMVQDGDRIYLIAYMQGQTTVATAGLEMVDGQLRWFLFVDTGEEWAIDYSNENDYNPNASPEIGQWYDVVLCVNQESELYLFVGNLDPYNYRDSPNLVCDIYSLPTPYWDEITEVRVGLPSISNCGRTSIYFDEVSLDYICCDPLYGNIAYDLVPFEDGFDSGFRRWSGVRTYNGGHARVVYEAAKFYVDRSSRYGQAYCFKNFPSGFEDELPYTDVMNIEFDFKVTDCRLGYGGRIYLLRAWSGNKVVLAIGWERTRSGLRWFIKRVLGGETYISHPEKDWVDQTPAIPELNTWYSLHYQRNTIEHSLYLSHHYIGEDNYVQYDGGYGIDRIDVGLTQTSRCRTASVLVDNFNVNMGNTTP